jgi:phosphatidylserine/phosphatidylglycerophosphate/cardiolipin synthase-like enzyme
MAKSAKRFWLCNLIPLWEIDEKDMEVDWPRFHAFFGDRIEMRADISKRRIKWSDPSLKIRFEIHESDFLLSGGLNDYMGSFFSHQDFADDDEPTSQLRPIKVVDDVDEVADEDKDRCILIQWIEAHTEDVTVTAPDGTTSTRHEDLPDTLRVRCWWKVTEEDDVSGSPEYYYDVYVEGQLENGDKLELHERSDHELEGFAWHVGEKPKRAQITPIVDGEYAFIELLQRLDRAQNSIHILNWKLDPTATLVLEPEFQGDYLQLPGMDETRYAGLLTRCKPLITDVSARNGIAFFGASNGNVAITDGSGAVLLASQYDDPTNIDTVAAVEAVAAPPDGLQVLVLDDLRSRLLLIAVVPRSALQPLARGVFSVKLGPGAQDHTFVLFELTPTLPDVMTAPDAATVMVTIAGSGELGSADGGLHVKDGVSQSIAEFNRPRALALHGSTIYIADTGNHSIRHITGFDTTNIATALKSDLNVRTLAGITRAGDADGTGAAARFNSPSGLAFDTGANRLLVADTRNKRLRAVDPASGAVTTISVSKIDGVAGAALGEPYGLAFDPAGGKQGQVFIAERDRHRILALDLEKLEATTLAGSAGSRGHADGPVAGARFDAPLGLALDGGKLFVADSENHVLRVIDLAAGTVSTLGSVDRPTPLDTPVVLHDVLRRKAMEGVNVRVLLDGYGSAFGRDGIGDGGLIGVPGRRTAADLRSRGATIQAFKQNHQQTFGETQLGSNHEKMTVVDSQVAVTGGIDFSSDKNDGLLHDRKHRSSLFWHDVVALVEGPAAYDFDRHFERRWAMMRDQWDEDKDGGTRPDVLNLPDRTEPALDRDEAEAVRTYDRSPIVRVPGGEEVREIRESYRRAILAAEHYVYLEHQYIYYPVLGEYLADAMRDNPRLQVIWCIPFFTEESHDPVAQRAQLRKAGALADSITDTKALARGGGTAAAVKMQTVWHGFFRQHEMVKTLRGIDPKRFGAFSIQRPFARRPDGSEVAIEMIYPHSKMLLADDRFVSIGSANANGRGFTRDGENNVSARCPVAAKAFRERLWGEHLGYVGVAVPTPAGLLQPVTGHHLEPGVHVRLRHHRLGDVEREVKEVDAPTGTVTLEGAPLDPELGRILWSDARFADVRPSEAIKTWRQAAHPLSISRVVKGARAHTDATGRLIVPGNVAQAGDQVDFGQRIAVLDNDGDSASSEPILQPHVAGSLEIAAVAGEAITLTTRQLELPDRDWIAGMAPGQTRTGDDVRPFQVRLISRSGGKAKLELSLAPNVQNVNYDHTTSWLLRQPGATSGVRAWEVDPPEGIEYGGPGSVLFSPWLVLPWLFVDVDVDELALAPAAATDTRVA